MHAPFFFVRRFLVLALWCGMTTWGAAADEAAKPAMIEPAPAEVAPAKTPAKDPPGMTRLGKDMEVRSEHLINWSLSGADQKRITQAGEYVTSDEFKLIPFSEYRELALKPQAAKQAKK